ncbi:CTR1 [Daphnia sinensis]|uniref:Copper transport protein n=1 Tax=Daphnia sinensis TaxID=1820382 RepID=A0AAD5LJM7_9CRUS|nr:CTR1 [Daphnia sinensis]
MSHDHHMMGHDGHDMHAAGMETTTMHDHAAMMKTATTVHNHGSGTDGGMMMMMQMYFYADYTAVVLFKQWDIQSVGAMVGSCIGIFLMAILYEGLKYFREYLSRKHYAPVNYNNVKTPEGGSDASSQVRTPMSFKTSVTSASHYIQTALHLLQMIISYFLMLIVMTYNVWLFISVILGCTVGYFFFGWRKGFLVDITEHCH